MEEILHSKIEDLPREHKNNHDDYEHYKRDLVLTSSNIFTKNKSTKTVDLSG